MDNSCEPKQVTTLLEVQGTIILSSETHKGIKYPLSKTEEVCQWFLLFSKVDLKKEKVIILAL